jgi:hypothetical protein
MVRKIYADGTNEVEITFSKDGIYFEIHNTEHDTYSEFCIKASDIDFFEEDIENYIEFVRQENRIQ